MRYTTRPLSDRTWLRPGHHRKGSQFDSTWSTTLGQLGREIDLLGGRDVVIEVDVAEKDIKLDGMLRANAAASTPAVVVAFETTAHGAMLYRCDRYDTKWSNQGPAWQHNVRAIALTLEALRAVDRHGATETGQQYTGFKALPSGIGLPASSMTRSEAEDVLLAAAGVARSEAFSAGFSWASVTRSAKATAHPDRNDGDRTLWNEVEQASRLVERTGQQLVSA